MNIEKTLPKAWESIETKLAKGTYNGSASDLKSLIDGKESSISKKSGFNLDKSDAINSNVSTTLATSAAVKTAYDKGVEALTNSNTKLTKGNLPAKITNAEDMYKLLENKSGLEFDPNLLYLNDAGTKTTGKAYFDRNKKGIFKCIQTTSSTTNSTTYFVDFSNNANSDRLTKLITFEIIGDETTGCKKYSNGYMELWGESEQIFKFIIPFKDTDYKCIVSRIEPLSLTSGVDTGIYLREKTTTYINVDTVCGGGPKIKCRILCQGYWK